MNALDAYTDLIEEAYHSEARLERLRVEVVADDELTESELFDLDGRIGTYLADLDRQREPAGGWDMDDAPEELPSLAQRRRLVLRQRQP